VKSFRLDRKKSVTYGMVVEAAVTVTLLKVWIGEEEEVVMEWKKVLIREEVAVEGEAEGSPRS
jgi:hypothetical protein